MIFTAKPDIELLYKQARITLNLDKKDNKAIVDLFSGLKVGEEYDISIKKRGKRSLNANNYHWALCEQIAKILKVSKYEVHNQLMIDYGTDWLDSNGDMQVLRKADDDSYLKSETLHFRPTDKVDDKGRRFYVLLLPSHLMNSKQMSELIDGTVAEAKELGIDTRTPDEIERIKATWATQA